MNLLLPIVGVRHPVVVCIDEIIVAGGEVFDSFLLDFAHFLLGNCTDQKGLVEVCIAETN